MAVKRHHSNRRSKLRAFPEVEACKSTAHAPREHETHLNLMPRGRGPQGESQRTSIDNPYVGPVPFDQSQRSLFFGREQEAEILLSLAISERVVLFYAQSGAGKSSLVNARLIPSLTERDYDVLPVVRVGAELPSAVAAEEVDNVYVFNTLFCLSRSQSVRSLLGETLSGLLGKIKRAKDVGYVLQSERNGETGAGGAPRYLIFDQFEEILTRHVEYWKKREEFFLQLRKALNEDPKLNVVFVMREDHLAGLDRYSSLIPDGLRVRYRMERLGHRAALEAIEGPAFRQGRPFEPGVAQAIVDDLAQLRMARQERTFIGEFVEPVQLQIVCLQLWESPNTSGIKTIAMDQWLRFGDTDKAMEKFFEEGVKRVAERTSVLERQIRRWFGETLITTSRIRAQVNQELLETGGLPNEAVDLLVNEHLICVEEARGGKWVELAHDRFISPILDSNKKFFLSSGKSPLTIAAKLWQEKDEDESLLLRGRALIEAQNSFEESRESFGNMERDFLAASSKAELNQIDAQRRANRRLVGLAASLVIFLIVAGVSAYIASNEARKANSIALELLNTNNVLEDERRAALEQSRSYKNLLREFRLPSEPGESQQTAEVAAEASAAREEIESRKDAASRAPITIRYFSRDLDPARLEASLKVLGFKFMKEESTHRDIPTNTVFFGKEVDIEEVQVVALTLIRGGVVLTNIQARQPDEPPEKWRNIGIGYWDSAKTYPALSVDDIRQLTKAGIPPRSFATTQE